MARPLPLTFYRRDAATVARDLLGKALVSAAGGVERRARIVETEAYVGPHDRASHSRHGKTTRNASMFGPPGRAYVYLVYGMHHCFNVVTGTEPAGEAVLVRGAVGVDGWAARMAGPGLVARAFGITRALDGHDLRGPPLWIEDGPPPRRIAKGPRIGVRYAGPWAHRHLRFRDLDAVAR